MGRYQKGKTNLDFTEARDSEWQWHQLGKSAPRSRHAANHASTPPLSFFTGRMPFLLPNQQRQSTEGKKIKTNSLKNVKNVVNKVSPRERRYDMPPADGSSTVAKIAADLRPSADGSAVRTSLVTGQLQAASVSIA